MTGAEKARAWRLANPEKAREMNARRRGAHKAWCAAHPERVREIKQRSQLKNRTPERVAWVNHRQRARRFGVPGPGVTPREWGEIMELFGAKCAYCLSSATERDHVVPMARGGADSVDNVVPCCSRCNLSKSSKTLIGWLGGIQL